MSRVHYLCNKCKLDNDNMCDYKNMGIRLNYCFCPKFIYDDGNPMTNADKIRSMTDEQLANYLIKLTEIIRTCDICESLYIENDNCNCDCDCNTGVLKWLKKEIK